jgi:chemosensory pili system protein ChpA (sensor histidine kinase/response regulator)
MALSREQRADISSAAHAMRSALLVLLTGGERVPLPTESLEASLSELDNNILDDAYHLGRNVVERVREIETCDAPAPEFIASALDAVSAFESHLNPLAIGEEALVEDVDLLIDESFDRMLVFDPVIDSADPVQDGGSEIDDELREVFAEEAESLLTSMGDHLDKLAVDPKDKEALWEIRRNAHTLKGSAGIVGLAAASEMAHRIEDLLDSLAESDAAPPPQIIPALLTATECLRAMAAGDTSVRVGEVRDHLFKEFDNLLALSGPAAVETPGSQSIGELETDASRHAVEVEGEHHQDLRRAVRVPMELLDELLGIARDGASVRSLLEQRLSMLDRQVDEIHNLARRLQSLSNRLDSDLELSLLSTDRTPTPAGHFAIPSTSAAANDFDPLEFDRYTDVHESLRELAETAADAADVSTAVEDLNAELEQLFRTQRRTIDTLQEQILRARRVNFGRLRPRLERIVRLTAADEGKLVELNFDNEDAEIDTQLLDSLTEPLQHLLKNAVVHGIETPEARRLLGKAETGSVAVQLDDRETHIEISVSDDGSGIAPEAIVEKAIRSGHISPDAARGMNEQDRTNLIFTKGLTTAEKLDLNAGRGIGMSIVKERVESLGGSIGVRSLLYGGTRFSLRLPLKLALTNALIVGVGRKRSPYR